MKTTTFWRVSALVLVLLWTCVTPAAAVDREHQQIMADIRMLQEQAQQLQSLLIGLGDALKAVNSRLDDQTGLERKAFADGKVQMDNISGDIRVVREKVDETNVRLSSLSQEMEALRMAIPPPAPVAPISAIPNPDGSMPPAAIAPPPAPAPAPGQTPQQLWQAAFADFSVNQFNLAVQGFESFLKYYPKNDQADDAQYYIGESYYSDGKFADAVTAYNRVIVNYPGTNMVPSAYYKRGRAMEDLKQTDGAKQSYEAVIKEFPDSQAATLAKQGLDRLNRPTR